MPLENQATRDAVQLMETEKKGLNADCIYQAWPHDRQLSAWRELNKMQTANPNDNLPDLTLHFDESGSHLVKESSQDKTRDFCGQGVAKELPKRQDDNANELDDEISRRFDAYKKEHAGAIEGLRADRLEHPEREAGKIRDVANDALTGEEAGREPYRLKLRRDMERLMSDPNTDYRDKVLGEVESNGSPRAKVTRDEKGNPQWIEFTKGVDKDEFPLNKSVAEQVDDAQKEFRKAIETNYAGESPQQIEAKFDIATGDAEPKPLRWFHISRKEEGRPAVDP